MGMRPPSRAAIVTALLFALSCFGATLFVWKSFGGPVPLAAKGYRFHVLFAQATNLQQNADVRISGVPVGKVVQVTPRGEITDAQIQLKSKFAPIPSDAHAILRFKTLLGETFVELSPGTPTAPKLREGGSLPTTNVEPTQQLDQVLSAFDAPTRQSLKRFLLNLSASLKGRGTDLNAALGSAGPAVDDLSQITNILDREQASVESLIRDGGITLRGLGRRQADLQGLISEGDRVFSATASRDRGLTRTVRALPPFLAQLRGTLSAAEGTATDLAPTLHVLRPVAPLLRPGLSAASRLAPQLRAAFVELRPVIAAARTGLPAATRVVNAARPLVDILYPAGKELVPVVDLLDVYKREIVTQLANLGAATQSYTVQPDGSHLHYLRVLPPFTNEGLVGAANRLPSNRHNPYFAPGALAKLATGLEAFDCANTKNSPPVPVLGTGAPPCVMQQPWTFQGHARSYPHVERLAK